jgi:secondary thiamine-phosphate synthase enzyme
MGDGFPVLPAAAASRIFLPMETLFEHELSTKRRCELVDITAEVARDAAASGIRDGLCLIFVPHTTAGVTINENADPDVRSDIEAFMSHLVPPNSAFRHSEGNSDSHIKSSLFGASLSLIIRAGGPVLGTWQGIYFAEFDVPRHRRFLVKCVG